VAVWLTGIALVLICRDVLMNKVTAVENELRVIYHSAEPATKDYSSWPSFCGLAQYQQKLEENRHTT